MKFITILLIILLIKVYNPTYGKKNLAHINKHEEYDEYEFVELYP